VLLINKGSHPVSLSLQLPALGPARVRRLLAPSVTARSGVTLDGQQLGVEGTGAGDQRDDRARGSWIRADDWADERGTRGAAVASEGA
jgi:hypothetical protein